MASRYARAFDGMEWLLEQAGYHEASNTISRLAEICDRHTDELEYIYSAAGQTSISQIVDGLCNDGRISSTRADRISDIWHQAAEDIARIASVPLRSFGDKQQNWYALEAMDYFGVLEFNRVQGTVSPFIHPSFSSSMFRYLTSMNNRASINHIETVAVIRGADRSDVKAQEKFDTYVKPLQEKLRSSSIRYVTDIMPGTGDVDVEFLPTSNDYYAAGIKYYRSGPPKCLYSIFSTTPGIMLPEEHYGSDYFRKQVQRPDLADRLAKNPLRLEYFRTLQDSSFLKPRLCFFDRQRAKKQYDEIATSLSPIDRLTYEEDASR